MDNCAKIIEIERLRIETDGSGVRSLVCFSDCPLKCKHCLNKRKMNRTPLLLSPNAVLDSLRIDDIYFKASSIGGVTFGGGEPSLQSVFIEEFRAICPSDWTVFIETSLNVPMEHIKRLSKVIDYWYIDIKDMNDQIYHKYTGSSNKQVIRNLQYLIGEGLADKITVRVPLIPGYNTDDDVNKSVAILHEMGIASVECFTYYLEFPSDTTPPMGIPGPDPPKYHKLLYVSAIILAVCAGILSAVYLPAKVVGAIGSIFIGIIVAVVLCLIIALIPWRKFDDTLSDSIVGLFEKQNDGRD